MTDHKELIETLRKLAVRSNDGYLCGPALQAADALEAAQAQMQEAYTAGVEGAPLVAKEIYAEATAAVKTQVSRILNYVEQHGRPDWANLGAWAHALEIAGMRVRDDITPASARDWLAQHDREIVERCAHIAECRWEFWTPDGDTWRDISACKNIAAAIRAGGEQ